MFIKLACSLWYKVTRLTSFSGMSMIYVVEEV